MITKKGRRKRIRCKDGSECRNKRWKGSEGGGYSELKLFLYRSPACHIHNSSTPQKVTGVLLLTLLVVFLMATIQFFIK
jgi:hypothetical protein